MKKILISILGGMVIAAGIIAVLPSDAYANEWLKNGNDWYYLNNDGEEMTGWVKDKGVWYYLDGNGVMQTGWLKDSNKWYFLHANGAMASSAWIQDANKWYYLYSDGAMLANATTPDGYYVNGSGEWDQSRPKANASQPAAASNTAANAGGGSAAMTGSWTVENVDADYAIEADITVTGSTGNGTGTVGKVGLIGARSAIAFDIQSDGATTFFWRENIHSNASGGQDYRRIDEVNGKKPVYGETVHLMIAYNKSNGTGTAYVNGELVDTFVNRETISSSGVETWLESGARENGHSVTAVFKNVRVKRDGEVLDMDDVNLLVKDNNKGLKSDTGRFRSEGIITQSGTMILRQGADWDTEYNGSSAIVSITE